MWNLKTSEEIQQKRAIYTENKQGEGERMKIYRVVRFSVELKPSNI